MIQIPTKLKKYVAFLPYREIEPVLPALTREGDAGYDLTSAESITLFPGERYAVRTGVRLAIPEGYAGLILPRSGMALHSGVTVLNSPGLIDSNYRGEIKVILAHLGLRTESWKGGDSVIPHWHQHNIEGAVNVQMGHRIAQLVIIRAERAEFVPVEMLDETDREQAGFGSSGN